MKYLLQKLLFSLDKWIHLHSLNLREIILGYNFLLYFSPYIHCPGALDIGATITRAIGADERKYRHSERWCTLTKLYSIYS